MLKIITSLAMLTSLYVATCSADEYSKIEEQIQKVQKRLSNIKEIQNPAYPVQMFVITKDIKMAKYIQNMDERVQLNVA